MGKSGAINIILLALRQPKPSLRLNAELLYAFWAMNSFLVERTL